MAKSNAVNVLKVAVRLGEFRDLVKEVVRSACRTALLEAGFTPDDYFYDGMESPAFSENCSTPRHTHMHKDAVFLV